jgi:cell division protein FtsN
MSRAADILANITFWSGLIASSGASFYLGFHYTHSATANVPVKQPVSAPTASPAVKASGTPPATAAPTPSPSLIPGPIPVATRPPAPSRTEAPVPESDLDDFQAPPTIRGGGVTEVGGPAGEGTLVYRVQVGAFDTREGAQRQVETLQSQGLNAVVVWDGGSYRAQLGAFSDRARAFYVADEINARGFAVTVRR